jgi:hypothetical protein
MRPDHVGPRRAGARRGCLQKFAVESALWGTKTLSELGGGEVEGGEAGAADEATRSGAGIGVVATRDDAADHRGHVADCVLGSNVFRPPAGPRQRGAYGCRAGRDRSR